MDAAGQAYAADAEVLARIGRSIYGQELRVTVRLPRELAEAARAAWVRDDTEPTLQETEQERALRDDAGHLALLGLAVEERSREVGAYIEVCVDAWQIGRALDAAEQRGLLADVDPPVDAEQLAAADPAPTVERHESIGHAMRLPRQDAIANELSCDLEADELEWLDADAGTGGG